MQARPRLPGGGRGHRDHGGPGALPQEPQPLPQQGVARRQRQGEGAHASGAQGDPGQVLGSGKGVMFLNFNYSTFFK